MNRELKFRAWIDNEIMVYLPMAGIQYFDFEGGYALSFVVDGYSGFWSHECYERKKVEAKIMQFTGLKDKNGIDVYEGDIITDGLLIGRVNYDPVFACFSAGDCPLNNKYLYKDKLEVKGNIYENPELLS